MSKEYIEKEAALEFLKYLDREHGNKHFIWGVETYAEYLQGLPPADVKPVVRGEWLYAEGERYKEYTITCQLCGASYKDCYDGYVDCESFNFCPNCGAEMRKEGKNE